MTDDFIPHITQAWAPVDEQVDGNTVLRPVSSRVITAARLSQDGADRVLILEFTGDDDRADVPTLRIELSGAAGRIIADALHEGANQL